MGLEVLIAHGSHRNWKGVLGAGIMSPVLLSVFSISSGKQYGKKGKVVRVLN
jgi:hypothetical protein